MYDNVLPRTRRYPRDGLKPEREVKAGLAQPTLEQSQIRRIASEVVADSGEGTEPPPRLKGIGSVHTWSIMDETGPTSMTFVAKKRARLARMAIPEQRRAAARIKLLLKQKMAELGNVHGAKAKAADALGLDRSLVNKLLSDVRMNVALETVSKVVAKTGVDRDFFLEPLPHDPNPDYRNYTRGKYKAGKRADMPLGAEHDHAMIDATLEEIKATQLERGVFWEAFSRFKWESVNATAVRMFIEGIRGGQSLQRALDAAINAGIDDDDKGRA